MDKIRNNLSPICYLPNGKLVCYKCGKIYILNRGEVEDLFRISVTPKERYLGRSKVISRLLRLGIRVAEPIDDNRIIFFLGNRIYELDIKNRLLSQGCYFKNKIRPLSFTSIKKIRGFDDGIYFGGYITGNNEKKEVSIYQHVGIDSWKIVYTFPAGEINHVHSIISDPFRNCVWIFTGDFESAAAIWCASNNFNCVKKILFGEQSYRGCVGFALSEGIVYATDTPFEKNKIYLLNNDMTVSEIYNVDGSCIYGCKVGNNLVFSSTVEADGRNETILKLLFNRRIGRGIKNRYVHLYKGNLCDGFSEIYKEKKDLLPFLFQFGAFRFPSGLNETNILFFQPIATNKNDLNLMKIVIP